MKTKTAGRISNSQSIRNRRLRSHPGRTSERPIRRVQIGHRFGSEKKLGVLFGASYDYNGRGIDNLQPAIDTTLSTFAKPFYDNNTIREYRYYRNRWGYAGTADYKLGQFSDIYLKGLYSNLKDYGDKWYFEPVYRCPAQRNFIHQASVRKPPSAALAWVDGSNSPLRC